MCACVRVSVSAAKMVYTAVEYKKKLTTIAGTRWLCNVYAFAECTVLPLLYTHLNGLTANNKTMTTAVDDADDTAATFVFSRPTI